MKMNSIRCTHSTSGYGREGRCSGGANVLIRCIIWRRTALDWHNTQSPRGRASEMKDKGEICGISPVVAVEVILFLMNQGVKQRLHRLVIIFGAVNRLQPRTKQRYGTERASSSASPGLLLPAKNRRNERLGYTN